MSTFTQIYYHIVFSTKYRHKTLTCAGREAVYKYIWGILKNKRCHLYRIGGTDDHLHLFTSIHPTLTLADLIKDLKVASTMWIKDQQILPSFQAWQVGYGGFTHSHAEKQKLINYVRNQDEHHRRRTFEEELRDLLMEAGIAFDEKYLL